MSRFTDSRDPRANVGILILQHQAYETKGYSLDFRGSILGARVSDRDDNKGGLGSWSRPKTQGKIQRSVGDLNLAFLWQYEDQHPGDIPLVYRRRISGFAFGGWPVVTQPPNGAGVATPSKGASCAVAPAGPTMRPIWDKDYKPDKRYQNIDLPSLPVRDGKKMWPKFPVDFFGIGITTTQEHQQVELFMPTDPRHVAVNQKGDAAMGTLVCDMGDDFKIDLDRMARLQSKDWVLKQPKTCNSPIKANAIAWNIGPTGCEDTRGGFVIERRAEEEGVPTPGGGGGTVGGPNDVATFDAAAVLKGQIARLQNLPGGAMVVPDAIEVRQRALNLLGGGGAGAGGGPGGGVGVPPVLGSMPTGKNGSGVIALISHFDSGHSDVGSKKDKHNMGSDADGRPINPLHISTNAYFRRNDFFDAPIEFGTLYVQPEKGRYIMPTYLRYDPRPQHPHACGPKQGLWRLESECVAHIVDGPGLPPPPGPPPPPPVATGPFGPPGGPPTGGGGGGETPGVPNLDAPTVYTIRQWQPGQQNRFAATEMAFSVPALLFRPQDLAPNAIDLRQAGGIVPRDAQKKSDYKTPVAARIEAFGYQTITSWRRTQALNKGRFAGGTVNGGLALMPPEFDITDYAQNFSRNASVLPATSTTYFVAVPGAYWAGGIPVPSTGGMKTGYRWGVNAAGDLAFERVNSSGTPTSVITLSAAGVISFGSSSSIALPAVSSIQMGSGAGTAKIKGLASNSDTTVGNVGLGEDDLKTYTLPANSLSSDNNCVHIVGKGKVVGGTSYVLKFHFGATAVTLFDGPLFFATDYEWTADIYVTRSSSGSQSVKVTLIVSNTNTTLSGTSYNRLINTTAAETDTAAIITKFTGESAGGTNNDITQHFMNVQFYNAP